MVYITQRLNLQDYEQWRKGFDEKESFRRAGGSTGINQIYRDLDNPNVVTVIFEWENAEKAQAFLSNPVLKEVMQAMGVVGAPVVRAIQTRM